MTIQMRPIRVKVDLMSKRITKMKIKLMTLNNNRNNLRIKNLIMAPSPTLPRQPMTPTPNNKIKTANR